MNKNNKININVNKDDQNINDFLYCWSELNNRPSRTHIYKNFERESFLNYFSEKMEIISIQQDILPIEDDDLINERVFSKISDGIWLSYTAFDIHAEDSFIGEVVLHYDTKLSDKIEELNQDLNKIKLEDDVDNSSEMGNLFSVFINQNGFDIEPILCEELFDNIDSYYNDSVFKKFNKLSKRIQNTPKGLSIIFGERGTGKTSIINYLSKKIKTKKLIFIPTTLFDNTINNPEFRNFLKRNKNSVIVLDDCELYFSDIYSKSNIFTNNLLQLVDSIDSDQLGINLLLILNCEKESEIDYHLLESNNLLDIIHVNYLKRDKVNELLNLLDKKKKIKNDTKLIDVLKNRSLSNNSLDFGFQ